MAKNSDRSTDARLVSRKEALKLTREEKNKLISEIQGFFSEERDEEIGIIAAETVLDFFVENLGITIYNRTLDEAKIWFSKRLEDLEVDYDALYK